MDLVIKIEQLSTNEIMQFFKLTKRDFPLFSNDEYIYERAHKLSAYASMVTCRTEQGRLIGIIAFYMNQPPLCYISHISVLDGYKGKGLFSRMFKLLKGEILTKGYRHLRLEVRKDNLSALKRYEHLGFIIEDESKSCSWYMKYNL